jgi:hypothetical protein
VFHAFIVSTAPRRDKVIWTGGALRRPEEQFV